MYELSNRYRWLDLEVHMYTRGNGIHIQVWPRHSLCSGKFSSSKGSRQWLTFFKSIFPLLYVLLAQRKLWVSVLYKFLYEQKHNYQYLGSEGYNVKSWKSFWSMLGSKRICSAFYLGFANCKMSIAWYDDFWWFTKELLRYCQENLYI